MLHVEQDEGADALRLAAEGLQRLLAPAGAARESVVLRKTVRIRSTRPEDAGFSRTATKPWLAGTPAIGVVAANSHPSIAAREASVMVTILCIIVVSPPHGFYHDMVSITGWCCKRMVWR